MIHDRHIRCHFDGFTVYILLVTSDHGEPNVTKVYQCRHSHLCGCTVDVAEAFIADDAVDTALHRQLKVRVQCRRMDLESEPAWNRPIGYSHVFPVGARCTCHFLTCFTNDTQYTFNSGWIGVDVCVAYLPRPFVGSVSAVSVLCALRDRCDTCWRGATDG